MRLKIMIVFFVLAIVTGACGAVSPVLSSGPSLPFRAEASPTEAVPLPVTGETAGPLPAQGLDDSAGYPFILDTDLPRYLPAFTQPDAGCAWVGVAGQVFDHNGAPLEGVVILVKGSFNGGLIDAQALSGQQKAYGASGFEVQIGDLSADTENALTLQLVNSKLEALSGVIPLATFNDCQRNLILVNFRAQSDAWQALLQ